MLASSAAAMQTQETPKRAPCGHSVTTHRHGVADAKRTTDLNRLRHFKFCARDEERRKAIQRRIEAVKEAREKAKAKLAALTPYVAPNGTRWAVPWSIVDCESGGDWEAVNRSSGALGPYQFLGWPVPWPVDSEADKLAHHKMAAKLYAGGSGASHWAQCL